MVHSANLQTVSGIHGMPRSVFRGAPMHFSFVAMLCRCAPSLDLLVQAYSAMDSDDEADTLVASTWKYRVSRNCSQAYATAIQPSHASPSDEASVGLAGSEKHCFLFSKPKILFIIRHTDQFRTWKHRMHEGLSGSIWIPVCSGQHPSWLVRLA